jgi:hypothetical protein
VANEGDDRRPTLARGNRLVVGPPRPVLLPRLTAAAERCSSGLRAVCPSIERDQNNSFCKLQFTRTANPRRSAMTTNRFKLLGLALGLALVALSLVPLPAHAVLRSRQLRRPVDLLFKRHLHHGGRPIRKRLRRLYSLGNTDGVLHRGHLAALLVYAAAGTSRRRAKTATAPRARRQRK